MAEFVTDLSKTVHERLESLENWVMDRETDDGKHSAAEVDVPVGQNPGEPVTDESLTTSAKAVKL